MKRLRAACADEMPMKVSLRRSGRRLIWMAIALASLLAAEVALRVTPMPAALTAEFNGSAEFVDREGRPLRTLLVEERRYASHCALADTSPHLVAATVSAEDRRFRLHPGVDPLAIARAVLTAVRGRKPGSGASTITQQLVKIAQPGPRTVPRKLAEMWLALRVERAWSKDRILEEYLNRLDYGNLQTGMAAASRHYFSKPPADLSTAEAALLAALPKAPSRLNPRTYPDAARERQLWILTRMRAAGHLDSAEQARALAEPMRLTPPQREFAAPHFVDLLLGRRGVRPAAGGVIRTTLDLPLNQFAEHALADQLARIADKHATSGAAVVLHNPTGDVLALAGSGDYFTPGAGQINGAWIVRSPGSAVKPFTYLLAIERGANPSTVVADVPTDFPTETGLYRPSNYNHRFHGPVSLRFALGNSLNVAAIRALQLGGGPEALQQRLAELGLTTLHHPADFYGLGLTLGNGEVRLLELANAFATLGRLGLHRPFHLLQRDGSEPGAGRRVCDQAAAFLVADMLADNAARAASFGLDSHLAFDFPVACKTGTSSDYRDNWALGFTPEFTVGVWMGNADGSPMRGITGVTGAAPVMREIFQHLRRQRGTSWFTRAKEIRDYRVHPLTGRETPTARLGSISEKCRWAPQIERASDYDAQGRVILPAEYAAWIGSSENSLRGLIAVAENAPALAIRQPLPGTLYFLDPDLPADGQWLSLRAESVGAIEWGCHSLSQKTAHGHPRLQLREGRHSISARDATTGQKAETWIEVKAL